MFCCHSSFFVLRLVFTNIRVAVRVGVVSRVINLMELKSEESECSISSDSVYKSVAYDPARNRCWSQRQKNKPIRRPGIQHFDWFILTLLLLTRIMWDHSNKVRSGIGILLLTPMVWFSLYCIALHFWLQLYDSVANKWKPAFRRQFLRAERLQGW